MAHEPEPQSLAAAEAGLRIDVEDLQTLAW
jgi:hypothetical protein